MKNRSASSDYYKPPPVIMPDEDKDLHKELSRVDPSLRNTEDYQELVKLMKRKNEQEHTKNERVIDKISNTSRHEGYKCDSCETEPIVGVRWKCLDCQELDLCALCKENGFEKAGHLKTHKFSKFSKAEDVPYYLDNDYKYSYANGVDNYLDTNYKK